MRSDTSKKHRTFWERYVPYGIALLAAFTYFYAIKAHDLFSDDALYSFRAFGWFDYVGGVLQTTPIQWFGSIPWWGNLSFHDAPPLVFFLQYLSFSLLGISAFAAKLPFALAGAGVVFVLYRLFLSWRGRREAVFAALCATVSSYAVWTSQAGFLEGIEIFFLALAAFFFFRYLENDTMHNALAWGVAVGFALLSKYTAIFFPAAIVLYALAWRRDIFTRKSFWMGVACVFIVLAPVIAYNANVFLTRGHFDAALSSMVGMHPDDFKIIASRSVSTDIIANIWGIGKTLSGVMSFPFFVLLIAGVVTLCVSVVRKRDDALSRFLFSSIVMASFMFSFMGVSERFLSIMLPFLIAAAVVFAHDVVAYVQHKKPTMIPAVILILCAIVGFELFFTINTHILARPVIAHVFFTSTLRQQSTGFNELEAYIKKEIFPDLPAFKKPHGVTEINTIEQESFAHNILLFDETMTWAPYIWYIQPYSMYYRLPVISLTNYLQIIPEGSDSLGILAAKGAPGMYYISGVSDAVIDPVKGKNAAMRSLETAFAKYLDDNGFFVADIKDNSGATAFKVYHVVFVKQ